MAWAVDSERRPRASSRIVVHLAAGDLGQPVVQRVEHAGHLLLARGDRGDGAAELEPRLGQGEGGVRVAGPARAGRQHAQGRTADLAAHAAVHRDAQDVQDSHHGEGRGQFGAQVLQFQPDRLIPLGVQGEQLGREPRGGLVVQRCPRPARSASPAAARTGWPASQRAGRARPGPARPAPARAGRAAGWTGQPGVSGVPGQPGSPGRGGIPGRCARTGPCVIRWLLRLPRGGRVSR